MIFWFHYTLSFAIVNCNQTKIPMEYRLKYVSGEWMVIEGSIRYGDFVQDCPIFSSKSIADCYAWLNAKKEGLILNF